VASHLFLLLGAALIIPGGYSTSMKFVSPLDTLLMQSTIARYRKEALAMHRPVINRTSCSVAYCSAVLKIFSISPLMVDFKRGFLVRI
jgi:hypothetical protein